MADELTALPKPAAPDEVADVHETACCVVGGGPGGLMLGLLLARQGIPVTLVEAHPTFERDFRGDTIHPGILEILDDLGLADRLHQLQHVRAASKRYIRAMKNLRAILSSMPGGIGEVGP